MRPRKFRRIAGFLLIAIVAAAGLGLLVMVLWNALVPDLFHGPQVTFWQAVGLLVLSHILLRGWGGHWHGGGWRHRHWKHRLEEKLASMTPEDREKLREEWKRRCGWYPGEKEEKKDQPKP
jgi:hypothetical protein